MTHTKSRLRRLMDLALARRVELSALVLAFAGVLLLHSEGRMERALLLENVQGWRASPSISRVKTATPQAPRPVNRVLRSIYFGAMSSKGSRRAAVSSRAALRPSAPADPSFPAFGKAVYPVSQVPNWGAMYSAAEWSRSFAQMTARDFVPVPRYDLAKLMTPFDTLLRPRNEEEVTRKLFYSTKHFSAYDLDAGEYSASHPGIDMKLAMGTPIGSIAGGRVHAVREDEYLGLHVIVEHRHPTEGTLYSVYGHFGIVNVDPGDNVKPGSLLGWVGMTGYTSAPHLHLQVDRGHGETEHFPYRPVGVPSREEADKWTMHPIRLIEASGA